jgi:hypothetical protein
MSEWSDDDECGEHILQRLRSSTTATVLQLQLVQ